MKICCTKKENEKEDTSNVDYQLKQNETDYSVEEGRRVVNSESEHSSALRVKK